ALFSLVDPTPLIPTLFPYTTLFRSCRGNRAAHRGAVPRGGARFPAHEPGDHHLPRALQRAGAAVARTGGIPPFRTGAGALLARRSEEHTSELQSRENLVCRLLLEKK